jgi:hypothetical protein
MSNSLITPEWCRSLSLHRTFLRIGVGVGCILVGCISMGVYTLGCISMGVHTLGCIWWGCKLVGVNTRWGEYDLKSAYG